MARADSPGRNGTPPGALSVATVMPHPTSPRLHVEWVQPGPATLPTALAFTGFGHRLDPWRRLRPPGWRLGVVEFPVNRDPRQPWTLAALLPQLDAAWREAPRRALLAFSFGGAPATAVAEALAAAGPDAYARPDLAVYTAPVQWSRIPWPALRAIPPKARLSVLKHGARSGSRLLGPIAARLGNPAVRQFADMVERYVGWDFVGYYLPYLDWIDPPARTLAQWASHPWDSRLVGAVGDTVIPAAGMRAQVERHGPGVAYHEVHASHYQALDAARASLLDALRRLEPHPTGKR